MKKKIVEKMRVIAKVFSFLEVMDKVRNWDVIERFISFFIYSGLVILEVEILLCRRRKCDIWFGF